MSPIVPKKGEKFTIPDKYLLFIFTIICCLLIVISFTTNIFNRPFGKIGDVIVVPFQRGISGVGDYLANRKEELINIRKLMDENAELKDKISALENENTKLMQDKYELDELRKLYEFDSNYEDYNKVGATVIYSNAGNWFSTFVLDKGYNDGIEPDMNVVSGSGLVGRVNLVGPHWCQVVSIISDNVNVSATVLNTSDNLMVSGNLETMSSIGEIQFSQLIDSSDKVNVGDKIVTSNISDKYLPGLLIGYITRINKDSNNLTKSGSLIPFVDFEHINKVLIILDKKANLTEKDLKKGYDAQTFEEAFNEEEVQ